MAHPYKQARNIIFAVFFGLTLSACDEIEKDTFNLSDSRCKTGQAQLSVLDGKFQNLCGCTESAGQFIFPPTVLTCTISRGTVVFFHFHSAYLKHQIRSTGTPSFVGSPIFDPADTTPIPSYGVTFSTAGTYNFQDDAYTPMVGQIIVN